jgi:nucleotide-binding universal stress UspA family protein
MFKHILIATDGSRSSEHAARMAVELARTHAARLTAIYAIDPYPFMGGGEYNMIGFDSYMTSAKEAARVALDHIKHLAAQGESPLTVHERLVEKTSVYTAILDTATDDHCDLIVVGSHGRSGIEKLLIGSVASKVVAHSMQAVLVIR